MSATKSFSTIIREAEDALRPSIDLNRKNLSSLRELAPQAEDAVEIAEDALSDLEADAKALSEVSPLDHAAAVSAVRLAELKADGVKKALTQSERLQTSVDTIAAQVVAQVLGEMYGDVKTLVTFAKDVRDVPRKAELPMIVVTQPEGTVSNNDGSISGEVIVKFYRSLAHRPLDAKKVDAAAASLGFHFHVNQVSTNFDDTVDTVNIKVNSANLEVPIILDVTEADFKRVGEAFTFDLADRCRNSYGGEQIKRRNSTMALYTDFVETKASGSKFVSEDIKDGVRTLVLESAIVVNRVKPFSSNMTIPGVVAEIVEEMNEVGAFYSGLGVLESAELVDSELHFGNDNAGKEAMLKFLDTNITGLTDQHWTPRNVGIGQSDMERPLGGVSQYVIRTTLTSRQHAVMETEDAA